MIMTPSTKTASRCSRSSAYAVEARVFQDGAQGHRKRPWAFFDARDHVVCFLGPMNTFAYSSRSRADSTKIISFVSPEK